MSPSDIIEIWRECPHLSQCQIDKLTGAGISVEALSSDPTDWGFALAADHVAFDVASRLTSYRRGMSLAKLPIFAHGAENISLHGAAVSARSACKTSMPLA